MSSILASGLLGAQGGRRREQGWASAPGRKEPFGQAGPQDSRVPISNPTHTPQHHRPQHLVPSANTHRFPKPALLKGTITHPPAPPPTAPPANTDLT